MEIVYIQAVLMDNGEIICSGKTIGWKDKIGKYVFTVSNGEEGVEEVTITKLK